MIEKLKELQKSMAVKHEFRVGDVVKWKDGLQNKRCEGPFVVLEILGSAVFDGKESSGSPYFKEPLDTVLGHMHDERLTALHGDSRRFEPAE